MRIGFTGTRDGMTNAQDAAFSRFIGELPQLAEFHHGDCLGADDQAADILRDIWEYSDMDTRTWRVIVRPPGLNAFAASNGFRDETRAPLPYLERNRAIVDACDVLVACPKGPEERRSGTWSTVRYARKQGKRVVILWPDGTVEGVA